MDISFVINSLRVDCDIAVASLWFLLWCFSGLSFVFYFLVVSCIVAFFAFLSCFYVVLSGFYYTSFVFLTYLRCYSLTLLTYVPSRLRRASMVLL